jgi:DNA-binding NarL/FixJ family response regulator
MNAMDGSSGAVKTRVLVVDDQISVRQMVAELIAREGGYHVVGEGTTGFEGVRLFRALGPEMVIAALALPEMDGAEMIRAMREERRAARILIYSGTRKADLIQAALAARPHGFVHKTDSLATLREGLAAVARGCSFFTPFATRLMDLPVRAVVLTGRERTVLQMVAEGMSTKQVAGRLSIAPKTVEHYRTAVMQKLGLRDVASLTRYAVRCGLVEAE